MIKEDGSVIHFNNPKVQASIAANTFAISGHAETKRKFYMAEACLFQVSYICEVQHDESINGLLKNSDLL